MEVFRKIFYWLRECEHHDCLATDIPPHFTVGEWLAVFLREREFLEQVWNKNVDCHFCELNRQLRVNNELKKRYVELYKKNNGTSLTGRILIVGQEYDL